MTESHPRHHGARLVPTGCVVLSAVDRTTRKPGVVVKIYALNLIKI
jgi:hypothetical protein